MQLFAYGTSASDRGTCVTIPLFLILSSHSKILYLYNERGRLFTLRNGITFQVPNDPRLGYLLSKDVDHHYNNFTLGFYVKVNPYLPSSPISFAECNGSGLSHFSVGRDTRTECLVGICLAGSQEACPTPTQRIRLCVSGVALQILRYSSLGFGNLKASTVLGFLL